MNHEEQRIKIAEAMGWKREKYIDTYEGGSGRIRWKSPNGQWVGSAHDPADICHLPDFPNSLDACATFERTLTDVEIDKYIETLHEIIPASPLRSFWSRMVRALAPQRCEAFLRVKSLWTPPAPQEAEKNL